MLARIFRRFKMHLDALNVPTDRTTSRHAPASGRSTGPRRSMRGVTRCRGSVSRRTSTPGAVVRLWTRLRGTTRCAAALERPRGARDLLQKHLEISNTLLDARAGSWAPRPQLRDCYRLCGPANSLMGLTTWPHRMHGRTEDFLNQLQSASSDAGEGKQAAPSTLTASEIADLNLTGAWFGRHEPTPPQGTAW